MGTGHSGKQVEEAPTEQLSWLHNRHSRTFQAIQYGQLVDSILCVLVLVAHQELFTFSLLIASFLDSSPCESHLHGVPCMSLLSCDLPMTSFLAVLTLIFTCALKS